MTDGEMLYAVFAGFYTLECLHWLPHSTTVLSTWAGRRGWAAREPSHNVAASGSGAALAWPFPPLGALMLAQTWPVLPDVEGLWIGPGQRHEGKRLSWAELKIRSEQRRVWLGDDLELALSTHRAATRLVRFLRAAMSSSGEARARLVESYWKDSLSPSAARAAARQLRLALTMLRVPCVFVFLLCFGWLPYLFLQFSGDTPRIVAAFVSLFLSNALIAFSWRYLDRRLIRDEGRRRWPQVLHLILMPAHAMRAHDLIGADLMAGIHPVAAGSAVLSPEALRTLASATWRSWRYRRNDDPLQAASGLVVPRLEVVFRRLGITEADLERAPECQHEARSYCPSCHEQFVADDVQCERCGIKSRLRPALGAS